MSKDCHVYIIARRQDGRLISPVKVGVSDNPTKRLQGIQTACPFEVRLVYSFLTPNREVALSIEKSFHVVFAEHRTYGEWFCLSPKSAIQAMCMNYRAMFQAHRPDIPAVEAELYLDVAGVVAAEQLTRGEPGQPQ